jgi:hypothetical protein
MRWGRILVAAVLLEVVLVAVLVPIGVIFGGPFMPSSNATTDHTVFFTAVPLACLVFGYVAGMLVVRKVSRQYAAHGLWVGVFATALYFLMCLFQEGGLPAVIAGYGVGLFWVTQVLRIAGCIAGAIAHGPSRPR